MAWQRVKLIVPGTEPESSSDALEPQGAISADLADADADTAAESEVFGEPGARAALWDRCRLTALFPMEVDVSAALERSGVTPLAASVDRLEDADWVGLTQRQFEPIRAGERLWIVPTWHAPPRPGDVKVLLDPGAAFGTGSHPTTRMCLVWLERNVQPGDSVLDYGCGSGILGLAALKLGAASAAGGDGAPLAPGAPPDQSPRNGAGAAGRGTPGGP